MPRIILVTGAAAGIGLATARTFAANGDTVVLADRDPAAAHRAALALGAPHHALEMDVSDERMVRDGVAAVLGQHSRIDVLANNAGIIDASGTPAMDVPVTTLERILRVNLTGSYLVAREVGTAMARQSGGAIVNLSSLIAWLTIPGRTPYAMSKSALLGFTRALACEWASAGVRVNAVLPGYVATDIVRSLVEQGKVDPAVSVSRVPLGRMAEPEEIARTVLWAAGNGYVTGASIVVDGGYAAYGGCEAVASRAARSHRLVGAPVVVISGGARGIGAATADRFGADGAKVIVLDRQPSEAHEDFIVDITDGDAVERVVGRIAAKHGRIDVLVNNAAIADDFLPTVEQQLSAFERGLAINLVAPFQLSQAVGRVMAGHGGGAIVNLSSIAARGGLPRRNSYCAAKAGIEAMTRSLACEWASSGIRVNGVAPGYVATPGVLALEAEGKQSLAAVRRRIPLGRLGDPAEIADAIAFLASPAASYVTGSIVAVDGGWSAFGDAGDASKI